MNCPYCDRYTPEDSGTCESCGKPLPTAEVANTPTPNQQTAQQRNHFSKSSRIIFALVLLGIGVLAYLHFTDPGTTSENVAFAAVSHQPGAEVDVKQLLQLNKTNIVDFYSDYCGPCRRISPLLKKLDQKRDDIVVIKLDINRPGVRGIDWYSPLARQYKLRSVPYFMIYDGSGELTHHGENAFRQIFQFLQTENIR